MLYDHANIKHDITWTWLKMFFNDIHQVKVWKPFCALSLSLSLSLSKGPLIIKVSGGGGGRLRFRSIIKILSDLPF